MGEKSKRGGLRNPPGGRPPKPASEKYKKYPLALPPDMIEWLNANLEHGQRNGFIVEAVRVAIEKRS
jgi:hypothetical protein